MRNRWSIVLPLAFVACSSNHRDTSAAPVLTDGGAPVPTQTGAPASPPQRTAPPSPREHDPLWSRARDEDPLERQRLAAAAGAAGLLEGVDDGGEIAATALAALPFADDADIALGRLADLAQTGDPAQRRALLEAILAIAGRPRRARELLDPEGVRRSAEIMVTLAGREDIPREERAIAVSAARALAEKGYLDPARIPTDLDPK